MLESKNDPGRKAGALKISNLPEALQKPIEYAILPPLLYMFTEVSFAKLPTMPP